MSPVDEEPEPLVSRIDPREMYNRRKVTSRSVGNFGQYIPTSQSLQSNHPFSSNNFIAQRSGNDATVADSVNIVKSRNHMMAIHEHTDDLKLRDVTLSQKS